MGIKQIKVNETICVSELENEVQLEFTINKNTGNEILLGLILLKEGLIGLAEMRFINFYLFIYLTGEKYSNIKFISLSKRVFKINLSLSNLEYIEYYILKYLRDGQAETEHIDIDFEHNNKEYTLKIKCNNYMEFKENEIKNMLK